MTKTKSPGYRPPEFEYEISLPLDRNEAACAIHDLGRCIGDLDPSFVSRYPSQAALQSQIGESVQIDPARIVVTAGGDDAIDRVMRLSLAGGRNRIVTHAPSFEMINVYANSYGGSLNTIPWIEGTFPIAKLIDAIDERTALVVITSPNNPTGGTVSPETLLEVSRAAELAGAKLLVDYAYIEFADQDATQELARDTNILIVRTFSKAWGLAGLRVGYLISPTPDEATTIRNVSSPFPVSAVSMETARRALADYRTQMEANVEFVKSMRKLVSDLVSDCGGRPVYSQANFVLAEFENADQLWKHLAKDGIGIRKFSDSDLLKDRIRITCPGRPADFLQLAQSLCRATQADFEQQKVALGFALLPEGAAATPNLQSDSGNSELVDPNPHRTWTSTRKTKETAIELNLNLDGSGKTEIDTGIGFLDHMLTALAFHAGMDLTLKCTGDLCVDDHHTSEDCALALGTAIDQAIGLRTGIQRFGFAYVPLDESLARTVIDLSGRPWPEINLCLEREMVGTWACENISHFFQSFAMTLKCSLHVDVIRGSNDHHRVEAAFKSLAKALKQAVARTGDDIPSTKGML